MKMSKFNEIGRSLLTKCGVDAKIFLSDVYNKRTQAKKHQADAPQCGRSMVEMLGVLAIIGVLSVGAIAGYSKAMFKYKMNKTMDIISHTLARVVELNTMNFQTNEDVSISNRDLDYGFECDLGTFDGEPLCKLPNGFIIYERQISSTSDIDVFNLLFFEEPFDSCVAFFNSEIYKNVPEEWWGGALCGSKNNCHLGGFIMVSSSTNDSGKSVYSKSEAFKESGGKSELNSQDILDACEMCRNAEWCNVVWYVKYLQLKASGN